MKIKFYLHVRMHSVLRTRLPLEGSILWIRLRVEEISVHLMQIIQTSFKFTVYIFFKMNIILVHLGLVVFILKYQYITHFH